MMKNTNRPTKSELAFFPEKKTSALTFSGGPRQREQLETLVNGEYWTKLNTYLFNCPAINNDATLRIKANAFKHMLQVYGSNKDQLPDFRPNKGAAEGLFFMVMSWMGKEQPLLLSGLLLILQKKIIALTNFNKHENFKFKQKPLTLTEITAILEHPQNIKIMAQIETHREQAQAKFQRINHNYRHKC